MTFINSNLITLKIVIFLFFGGIGCLLPFLPLHMTAKGLSDEEKKTISLIPPFIALIGPLIVAPVADKCAGGSGGSPRNNTGKYLRIMISLCFIISAIMYWLLMAVPIIEPCTLTTIDSSQCDNSQNLQKDKKNLIVRNNQQNFITLMCDSKGGEIIVEKCMSDIPCTHWDTDGLASFYISDCSYRCESEGYNYQTTISSEQEDTSGSAVDYEEHYDEANIGSGEGPIEAGPRNKEFHVIHGHLKHIPHPHFCYGDKDNQTCHVYSLHSKAIQLRVPLKKLDANPSNPKICVYPIRENFYCRMGPKFVENKTVDLTATCNPVIRCSVQNPVNKTNSVYIESTCSKNTSSFWWYLIIRSIADIFPAAAVTLLDAAIVIATRETSTGRGDVGKQFAAGALGFAIFAPIMGAVNMYIVSISLFTVCMVIAALIILLDSNMPLSPPEWWWHTRCGLLALPMSSIKKYGLEIGGLSLVLLALGVFFNGTDVYLAWHIMAQSGNALNVGLTITVGALPAVLFLIFIEKIVDYCGHTNILISTFAFYIIHYTAMSTIGNSWLYLISEALEIFTLHIMWVTAVMYLRHLVPRKFTVCGQAIPVITHFCMGRLIGALVGALAYPWAHNNQHVAEVYQSFAVAAAVIAIFYFTIYHFLLKPRYAAPVAGIEQPTPALIQSVNGNGAYTPLRVYHNGKAKKGQFKY